MLKHCNCLLLVLLPVQLDTGLSIGIVISQNCLLRTVRPQRLPYVMVFMSEKNDLVSYRSTVASTKDITFGRQYITLNDTKGLHFFNIALTVNS